jgi:uncharacterized linocin/CFP29 family protein
MYNLTGAAHLDLSGQVQKDLAARVLAAGGVQELRALATTLREKEWETIDTAIVNIARPLLVGVNDLRARPELVKTIDAMQTTVLAYDKISDLEAAEITMKLSQRPKADRPTYARAYVPLPFFTKFFQLDARELNMGRKLGTPLDTSAAAASSAKVAELAEQTLFNGASSYTAAGGTLYGYTDFPSRNTVSLGTSWVTESGENIVIKVIALIDASVADNHFGPWILYVPQAYAGALSKDHKANSSLTVSERIRAISGIIDVKVAPKLTANNVVLVEMSPLTIELVMGMDITNIPWNTEVGDLMHLVAACMIPLPKADADGRCGIVHAS